MTKIIVYPQQIIPEQKIVINSCNECPNHTISHRTPLIGKTKALDFCTGHLANIKDVTEYNKKNKKKTPIYKTFRNKNETYVFIENPKEVPSWCMLTNLEAYIGACSNCGYEVKYPVCTKCGALFLSEKK